MVVINKSTDDAYTLVKRSQVFFWGICMRRALSTYKKEIDMILSFAALRLCLFDNDMCIWGFPRMVVPRKHPKMIIFSRKTHGCWVPPF